jgi:hypothetical protein
LLKNKIATLMMAYGIDDGYLPPPPPPPPSSSLYRRELYQTYKQKTLKVTDWIIRNARLKTDYDECLQGQYRVSLQHLLGGAQYIKEKGILPPHNLYWDLKDAISLRREMTQHYKIIFVEADHQSHEYFTKNLQRIFKTFFPAPSTVATPHLASATPRHQTSKLTGMFSNLAVEEPTADEEDETLPKSTNVETKSGYVTNSSSLPPLDLDSPGTMISDDKLGSLFALIQFIDDMDDILKELMVTWSDACQGKTSLAFATWVASLAVAFVEHNYQECKLNGYLEDLVRMYERQFVCGTASSDPCPSTNAAYGEKTFLYLQEMIPVYDAIRLFEERNCKDGRPVKSPDAGAQHKPEQCVPVGGDAAFVRAEMTKIYYLMVLGLGNALAQDRTWEQFGGRGLPEMRNYHVNTRRLQGFLRNPCRKEDCKWRDRDKLAIALMIQMRLYQAWIAPSMTTSTIQASNCRLKLLQHVQESERSLRILLNHPILSICPCCKDCLHPNYVYADCLSKVTKTKLFNLYHQAPMTAGSQILHIAICNNVYGNKLCNNKGLVGAVLHLYNALLQTGNIKEIPVFEKLSEILTATVFLGNRAAPNYWTCFKRFFGGKTAKIKTRKGQVSYTFFIFSTVLGYRTLIDRDLGWKYSTITRSTSRVAISLRARPVEGE